MGKMERERERKREMEREEEERNWAKRGKTAGGCAPSRHARYVVAQVGAHVEYLLPGRYDV